MRSVAAVLAIAACARGGGGDVAGDGPPRDGQKDAAPPRDTVEFEDAPLTGGSHLVINEVDYDQVGTDSAEYIELYNPGTSTVSLTGLAVLLVNGANNTVYATIDLSPAMTLDAQQYLVIAGNAVTNGGASKKLITTWTSDAVQNGAPDGIALVDDTAKTVIDVLSYEGAITAAQLTDFPSTVSLVEGTALGSSPADSNTAAGTLCRNPDGQDTDNASTDWKFCAMVTPGTANM